MSRVVDRDLHVIADQPGRPARAEPAPVADAAANPEPCLLEDDETMQRCDVWQDLYDAGSLEAEGALRDVYRASLGDGRRILLPIRPLADGRTALASLIINQASFAVQDAIAEDLAEQLRAFTPDVIVGLPTLGLTLASAVARHLGHSRYVPLGTSRKFWYEETLSVPLSSITTRQGNKRLYVDPRMVPLLAGRRVALVDDVISTGSSIRAGIDLLALLGVEPVAIGTAMLQSDRWRDALDPAGTADGAAWAQRVCRVFDTPLLESDGAGGWRRP